MLIKRFLDQSYLEYDNGNFDKWCVYINDNNGSKKPPKDIEYFSFLKEKAITYGADKIYNDFLKIYNLTTKEVNKNVLDEITDIATGYYSEKLDFDKTFSILYMAMIAEENKAFTKLGKRIKRLGIHKLLYENSSAYEAANFMKGMNWKEIDKLCKERGF